MKQIGAVILAGGQSRRMGTNKALLELGGETFMSRIIKQLGGFREVLLSVDNPDGFRTLGLPLVKDIYPNSGPIGGIYSALTACQSDYLLVISCDLPFFDAQVADYMCSYIADEYDAYPAVTRDGRIHPLCCIYAKTALPALRMRLQRGELRLMDAFLGLNCREIHFKHSAYSDDVLYNINDHTQYMQACKRIQGPPVVAVSGVKNSGKTTFLKNLIPPLRDAGLKVAAIKHDGHDFQPDVPGTDSHTLRQTGAEVVSVYSKKSYMLTADVPDCRLETVLPLCRDMDLIFLEGGKYTPYPKIELVRAAISQTNVCDINTLLAVCTDTGLQLPGVPSLPLDAYAAVAELLLKYIRGEYYPDTSSWEGNPVLYGFPIPVRSNIQDSANKNRQREAKHEG